MPNMEERAARIAELTRLLTPVADMALLMDMPERELRELLARPASPERLAGLRAKAEATLSMRQRDIELANAGSPTAAANVSRYLAQMLADEP